MVYTRCRRWPLLCPLSTAVWGKVSLSHPLCHHTTWYPSTLHAGDRKIRCAKYEVEKAVTIPLEELHDKKDELDFWVRMVDPKKGILRPESAQFDGNTDDLKEKLKALRNYAVAVLVFVNILWMALILLIRNLGDLLEMVNLKDGPISSIYLVSYFIIIILQFGALFIHRMETLLHVVARNNAPHRVRGHWFNPMATVVIESDEHS